MEKKNSFIITGGSLDDALVTELINKNQFDLLIASDHGIGYFSRNFGVNRMLPDLVLGDFDSATAEEMKQLQIMGLEPERYPAEKDWTDTELAIRRAIELGANRITLVGATGTRLDHVLGNLGLLGMGLEAGVEIILVDRNNRIRMIDDSCVLKKEEQYGDYVSLYPLGGVVSGLTLTGFKYPLEDAVVTPWQTLCISNEITADFGEIRLKNGRLLVIESKD